jgi:hypothetical protein
VEALLVFHRVGAEEIGEIGLRRRAGLDTDLCAVEFERRGHVHGAHDQEALAVMIGHAGEGEAEAHLTFQRPGRIARKQVDGAGAQGVEALARRERNEGDLRRIVEDRAGDGTAEVDVEARPFALRVLLGEAEQPLADAALQGAALLDGVERAGGGRRGSGPECRRDKACGRVTQWACELDAHGRLAPDYVTPRGLVEAGYVRGWRRGG